MHGVNSAVWNKLGQSTVLSTDLLISQEFLHKFTGRHVPQGLLSDVLLPDLKTNMRILSKRPFEMATFTEITANRDVLSDYRCTVVARE
jgi:hypothetical protein